MTNIREHTRQKEQQQSAIRAEDAISWAVSPSLGPSVLLTSWVRLTSLAVRYPQLHQCRILAVPPALEMSQLNEEVLARRTIPRVQSERSESDGIRGRSPSHGESFRVLCEALLSASPAPREIVRNRIGACGLCRTSSEIIQSPILASWSSDLHTNFINGLPPTDLQTHRFVRSQPSEAPMCVDKHKRLPH